MSYKEFWDEVDSQYKVMKRNGFSHDDTMNEVEGLAKSYGTILDQLNGLPGYKGITAISI